MNKTYCREYGSISPMLRKTLKQAKKAKGRFVSIPYKYKTKNYKNNKSLSTKSTAAYYNKKLKNYRFVGTRRGIILVRALNV